MALLSASVVGKTVHDAHVQPRTLRSLAAFRLAGETKLPIPTAVIANSRLNNVDLSLAQRRETA